MDVSCTDCEHVISIPDSKLPKGKAFNVTCPKCKNKVKVDQHLADEKTEEDLDTASIIESDFEDDEEIPIYEENDRIALILDDRHKDAWTKTLTDLGYKIQSAKSPEHAAHKLKFTQFHMVALHEKYAGKTLDENEAYQFLIEMPMTTRRKIFAALVGSNLKTMSNMQAFAASVNMVVNEKDMDELGRYLKMASNENDTFYKVFKETLTELGKV